jgi:hypothetical protein
MDRSEKQLRIGVTGHRKLSSEQAIAIEPLIRKAIDNIIFYHQNTFGRLFENVFTTSLAEGADSLFARVAVERFDCTLKILLPFEAEEYIKDFETDELRDQFKDLLHQEKVTQVQCLQQLGSKTREELYFDAGRKIVDENDYIIAVWNEEPANGNGGTGDIAGYAINLGKNLLVINPFREVPEINGSYLPEFTREPYNELAPGGTNGKLLTNFFEMYDTAAVSNQLFSDRIRENCFNLGLAAALMLSMEIAFYRLGLSSDFSAVPLMLNIAVVLCIMAIVAMLRREKRSSFHENYLSNRYIAERLRVDDLFFKCGFYPAKSESEIVYTYVADFKSYHL